MKKTILLIAFVAAAFGMQAQKVTRFSGTGDQNAAGCDVGGSGMTPDVATWGQPWGLATDTNGNIWVTENLNHRVRMITADLSLVYSRSGDYACPAAGGQTDGAASAARYNGPTGIAVGPNNKIYVADQLNNCIRVIDAFSNVGNAQSVKLFAGSASAGDGYADGTGAAALFNSPMDVAVDKDNNVYVADLNNNCIRKITPAGVVTTFAGSTTAGYKDSTAALSQFAQPWGLAFDNNGDLLVADFGNYRIRKINVASSPVGNVTTVAGNGSQTVKDGSTTTCSFNSAYDLIVDKNNNIFVAEGDQSHVLRLIDPLGNVSTLAGVYNTADSTNGVGTNAKFNSITGLALTKDQKYLIVADDLNHSLRKIDISNLTPVIDFISDKSNVKEGDVVAFTNSTSITTGTTYTWTITPGTSGTDWTLTSGTTTSRDISVKFLKQGSYTVDMTAKNTLWGTKSVTKNAMITVSTTGIEYIPFTGLEIYPNPSNENTIYINSKEFGISTIQIMDMQGKLITTINANGSKNLPLDVTGFEKGIYMIKTTSGDLTNISKIILQ